MLWFKQHITLESSLPPAEVWERLNRILPRFLMPPGIAIPRHSINFSRNYVGSLKGERFTLSGPTTRKAALHVEGVISRDGAGTLIHLTVRPTNAMVGLIVCSAGGVVGGVLAAIEAIRERDPDVIRGIVAALIALPAVGCLAGLFFFAFGCLRADSALSELLRFFEALLNARRCSSGAVVPVGHGVAERVER